MSTNASACEISVLHSSSTESYLIFILPLIVEKDSICFFLNNALHLPSDRLLWEYRESLTWISSALSFYFPLRGSSPSFDLFHKILITFQRLTSFAVTILLLPIRWIAWKSRFSTFTPAISNSCTTEFSSSSPWVFLGARLALHILCEKS